jgi:hypothetical protein
MNIQLKEKDEILTLDGHFIVTKVNDKSVWLNDKRYGLEATLKKVKSIIHQTSPDIKVDWINKKEAYKFYLSFKRWSFYISNGCKYITQICEVKDNMLLYNGEYYVPAPKGTYDDFCKKLETDLVDGLYYVRLYKRVSGYYEHQGGEMVNVFSIEAVTSTTEQDSLKIRKTWDYYGTPKEQSVEHIKSLDLSKLLSKELNFVKDNMGLFFKEHLPFKASNGVQIGTWSGFSSSLSCSKGLLYIDNSYRGNQPSGLEHGLMFRFHPSFSNESQYYSSCKINEFSPQALESIAIEIENSVKRYANNLTRF